MVTKKASVHAELDIWGDGVRPLLRLEMIQNERQVQPKGQR